MDCVTILAQAVETASERPEVIEETIVPIDLIWEQITSLELLEALTFISFGAICLFYGWRIFKMLVIICFGLLGLFLGMFISEKVNGDANPVIGALIGLVVMAVLSVPLVRWAVCILGALAGGLLTSGIWFACELTEEYMWAGALIGLVAGGMISFIIFKAAVMLFTSLGGGGLIATGILALLYLYPQTTEKVEELVFTQRWFLPVALLVPTTVGIIIQNKFVKKYKEWRV
ncbi:MAG: hypothetical protein JSV82_04880 [Planctomycetota bacterium]|nr:MAG: hypothetical protein JSV82_04880 [Planctomycetota bacterium]